MNESDRRLLGSLYRALIVSSALWAALLLITGVFHWRAYACGERLDEVVRRLGQADAMRGQLLKEVAAAGALETSLAQLQRDNHRAMTMLRFFERKMDQGKILVADPKTMEEMEALQNELDRSRPRLD